MFAIFLFLSKMYFIFLYQRYAIGNAERPMLRQKIGWLDLLADQMQEPYFTNNTGGPSIKVLQFFLNAMKMVFL